MLESGGRRCAAAPGAEAAARRSRRLGRREERVRPHLGRERSPTRSPTSPMSTRSRVPSGPDRLVLVMNTLPFAPPSAPSTARLPLPPAAADAASRRTIRHIRRRAEQEPTIDCVFSGPLVRRRCPRQEGTLRRGREVVSFRVNDEEGGSGHGVRVFAGPRWDPFMLDAPAALKTIATGELALPSPAPSTWTATVRRSWSRSTARRCRRRGARRGRRRIADPRPVQRPNRTCRQARGEEHAAGAEAVRSGQSRPRIRNLYNMEDAFQLATAIRAPYRARLDANLAFWDGLDGKTDWPRERERRTR